MDKNAMHHPPSDADDIELRRIKASGSVDASSKPDEISGVPSHRDLRKEKRISDHDREEAFKRQAHWARIVGLWAAVIVGLLCVALSFLYFPKEAMFAFGGGIVGGILGKTVFR